MLDGGVQTFSLVNVARLDPIKDHETLFAALRIARDRGCDVRLTCAGRNAEDGFPEFDALVAKHGLQGVVTGLGQMQDVEGAYKRGDAFILSSTAENAPIVVAEALASGLTVISTDVGDVREVAGELGLIVPVRDSTAMADAIVRLASDGELRLRARHDGPARVARLFDETNFVKAWEDMLAAPPMTLGALAQRPLSYLRRKVREAVPPAKIWIMAAIAWSLSFAITWGLVPLIPSWWWLAWFKGAAVWTGTVMYFFGLFGLLAHVYNVLVGGIVDKAQEAVASVSGRS